MTRYKSLSDALHKVEQGADLTRPAVLESFEAQALAKYVANLEAAVLAGSSMINTDVDPVAGVAVEIERAALLVRQVQADSTLPH